MSLFKKLFRKKVQPPKESQTPVWDKSSCYDTKIGTYEDPLEKEKHLRKIKEYSDTCVKADICMRCGGSLTREVCFDDPRADSIDVIYYSCEPCKTRYKSVLY